MTILYRFLPAWLALWLIVAATPAPGQEAGGSPTGGLASPTQTIVHEHPLIDPGLLDFVKVFGLGGMVFIIWLFDYRRQRGLEDLIKRYDETQKAHLEAFKDFNERTLALVGEFKETAVMCATVNATVNAKLEQLTIAIRERSHGQP